MTTITIGTQRRDGKYPVTLVFPGQPNAFGGFYPSKVFRKVYTPEQVAVAVNAYGDAEQRARFPTTTVVVNVNLPTLTPLEERALVAARVSSEDNGHDFGFVEDVVKALKDLKPQAVGGVITSLQSKGVLEVYEPVTTDSGTWTQFILADAYRQQA